MRHRLRYRFLGRWGGRLHWEARIPGDSRVEHVDCDADWFWRDIIGP